VVGRLADRVIVTSDNPRGEDPDAIIGDILGGMKDTDVDILVEPDRRAAIAVALAPLTRGDVLVVAGKGHERTQDLGDRIVDFDDRAVITELLEWPT
jgi:UDP-N-acetylmuramoyl-L-alanyl-D-glutamate--2,6-diaminopimelate ligase